MLTVQQIKNSPHPYRDLPVSQYQELLRRGRRGWFHYLQKICGRPLVLNIKLADENGTMTSNTIDPVREGGDPHLRSVRAISGFGIRATDGELGRIEGFLVDESDWSIRHIRANTKRSWFGKRVLISPVSVEKIHLGEKLVYFNLSRQEIQESLLYDPSTTRF